MEDNLVFMVGYHPKPLNIGIRNIDESIDAEVANAITSYFVSREMQFSDALMRKSVEYFRRGMSLAQRYEASNIFFTNLTGAFHNYLMLQGRYSESAKQVFRVLKFARALETNLGFELHLGTPYYFLGEAALMQGDIETGLMAMSASRKQDRTHVPGQSGLPAELFITFDDASISQHFRGYVTEVADYIRNRIWLYLIDGFSAGEVRLCYEEFRFIFVENESVPDDLKLFFLYGILAIKELEKLQTHFAEEDMAAPLIYSDATLRLTSLMDFFTTSNMPIQEKFAFRLSRIAKTKGFHSYPAVKTYVTNVGTGQFIETNGFEAWLNEMCDGTFQTSETTPRVLSGLEADLVLTHGIRNFSAHTIKSEHALWKNHEKVTQGICNAFFLIVQTLLR